MNFVTELEAKLHAALVELRDDFDYMIKQFRSSAAVTDTQLQASRDKAHAAIEGDAVVQEPDPVVVDQAAAVATNVDQAGDTTTEQPTA